MTDLLQAENSGCKETGLCSEVLLFCFEAQETNDCLATKGV